MAEAIDVVGRYKQAFGSGEMQTARSLLADDFRFEGPFDTFDNPDDYLQSLAKLAPIVEGVDVKKVLADGDDVVTIYDLKTSTVGTSRVAEWATVKDGKIVELRAYFDARPFASMFAG